MLDAFAAHIEKIPLAPQYKAGAQPSRFESAGDGFYSFADYLKNLNQASPETIADKTANAQWDTTGRDGTSAGSQDSIKRTSENSQAAESGKSAGSAEDGLTSAQADMEDSQQSAQIGEERRNTEKAGKSESQKTEDAADTQEETKVAGKKSEHAKTETEGQSAKSSDSSIGGGKEGEPGVLAENDLREAISGAQERSRGELKKAQESRESKEDQEARKAANKEQAGRSAAETEVQQALDEHLALQQDSQQRREASLKEQESADRMSRLSEKSGKDENQKLKKASEQIEKKQQHIVIDERSPRERARQKTSPSEQRGAFTQDQRITGQNSLKMAGQNMQNQGEQGDTNSQSQSQMMHVQFRPEAAGSSQAQMAKSQSPGELQNQLLQQLRQELNSDIVKRSSILVRNNGSGEIRLDLKPAELGQVRIRITLENNHIAGKIFVENSNVKEAFDQNMQQLYRAFKEHGFEDASLNVSVGDHRHRQQQKQQEEKLIIKNGYDIPVVGTSADDSGVRVNATNENTRLVDVLA